MGSCIILALLMGLFLPALFFLLFFNIAAFSFTKLGLSPTSAVLLFSAILMGSVVNIPLSKKRIYVEEPHVFRYSFLFYYPPRVRERVIAVNLGGAVIPTLFSVYLVFTTAPFMPTVLATAVVTAVAKRLARPVPGVGISMPAFIPPLIAAAAALILTRGNAAPVAFVAGTLGTLIGADLLNLHRLDELGAQVLSIGGAGVFDGIFLVGIVAAFLT